MPFVFQVKIVSLNPKQQSAERKKSIRALYALKQGSLICAQVYENPINGFENRLLVVTRKFDEKLESIGLAGIPEIYAGREHYPKMLRLVERDVKMEDIARFTWVKEGKLIRVSTKNGEQAVGGFHKANFESGYPGITKLEIVLIGGNKKKPVEEIVEISDISSLEFLSKKAVKKEVFAPYEFR
ncbi:MAG: hypothetical protein WC263_01180 [Candidatus Micrarchaeia archaeon]|jgi:hypothetical protein